MTLPGMNIRSKIVYLSSGVYAGLQAIAALEGWDCVDAVADKLLAEALANDPREADRRKFLKEGIEEAQRKLRDKYEDKLPMHPVTE